MNILRFGEAPAGRTGGMARYMHFVTDELRAEGHNVELVLADQLSAGIPRRLRRFVVPLRVVAAVARRLARGERIDVVDIHEPSGAAYAIARRAWPWLPPMIACVYGVEARAQEVREAYARAKGHPLSLRARLAPRSVIEQAKLALRLADFVTVETTEDAEYLRRRLGVRPHRIGYLHGGVDASLFSPSAARDRNGILFLGTWLERKGILDLVPAIGGVLKRHPGTPVTLAGTVLPAERVLADLPAEIRGAVHVVPLIGDDQQLAEVYRSHRIFAFPSTFEGQPLVMLEAAASGLAIATTRTCGMKDFIRDGENGLLAPVGDTAAFTAALIRLVEDPTLAARLGEAAGRDAQPFTWKRAAQQFLAAAEAARGSSCRQ